MKHLLIALLVNISSVCVAQTFYSITDSAYVVYGLSTDTKPLSPPNECYFVEVNTNKTFVSSGGTWSLVGIGVDSIATRLSFVTDSLSTALATFTQSRLNDTSSAIRTTLNGKQPTITTGTTAQYFRGDLSLATFPTTTAPFTNSTNKNFVTDAQLTVLGNTSNTNSGNDAPNSLYSGLAASKQDVNANLTTIAGLTATTDNFMVGTASAWASRTPTQARTQMGLGTLATQSGTFSGTSSGTNTGDNSVNTLYSGLAASKQDLLVSATNIKTINGSTVLGSGDLVVGGADPTKLAILNNLSDLNNTGTARTNIGLGNVTNESKATMFTNSVFTGTFNVADGAIANADLANGAVANLSGTNSGDNAVNTLYSGLAASKADIASPAFTGTPTGIGIPRYAQVTGANVTTTGQALVDITGLTLALVINATYEFEAVLSVSTSAVTTGTAYGINYSVAGGAVEAQITGASTSTASKTLRINALNTATSLYLATSAQTGGVVIKGRVTTGANAGNLTVSHLKLTSGTSTVFIGSFLKVTRIN